MLYGSNGGSANANCVSQDSTCLLKSGKSGQPKLKEIINDDSNDSNHFRKDVVEMDITGISKDKHNIISDNIQDICDISVTTKALSTKKW